MDDKIITATKEKIGSSASDVYSDMSKRFNLKVDYLKMLHESKKDHDVSVFLNKIRPQTEIFWFRYSESPKIKAGYVIKDETGKFTDAVFIFNE